jgi:hydrogenase expression/formation protein HypE
MRPKESCNNFIHVIAVDGLMAKVIMNHGAGGEIMQEFISKHVTAHFPKMKAEVPLDSFDDSAVVDDVVFTTDGHTVRPLFFPGGDLGSLSVAGTVNDISVMGGTALALSCGLILEEGLDVDIVDRVLDSMGKTAAGCGVPVATGDTKVMEAGSLDQMVMVTSAIGKRSKYMDRNIEIASQYRKVEHRWATDSNVRPGDAIIVSGSVGDHGIALLSFREGYGFDSAIKSDVAPLNNLIEQGLKVGGIVSMKDPTRGGLANTLNEWCSKSKVAMDIDEPAIPLKDGVVNACDMLGIDPLSIGNEGKVVIACVPEMADQVLKALHSHKLGKDAAIIGHAVESDKYRVIMKTEIGGKRILEPPAGDPVPRIC